MPPENYAFVMNLASLPAENYTLAPGHVLRRATREEIGVIKQTVERLGGMLQPYFMSLWESEWPRPQGRVRILPESRWRYFVIGFRGNNATMCDIEAASDLAPVELEVGFTIVLEMGGVGSMFHEARIFHVLEDARTRDAFFVHVSEGDLQEIINISSQLQRTEGQLIDIKRLSNQVGQLKGFPHQSPLRFLGYFAVLESLLTHPPKGTDPYDSVTRQVKKKISLLDNRWTRRIDYSLFGGGAPDTVWNKMYAYRSLLAHGGSTNFTGDLTTLGSHDQALQLVKETVKAVIRQALIEPRLLLDLREC